MKNIPVEKYYFPVYVRYFHYLILYVYRGETCWITDILNSNYNPMSGMVSGESQVVGL